MNKIVFPFLLSITLLFSCEQKSEVKVPILHYSFTTDNQGSLLNLEEDDFLSLLDKKSSFPLLVYGSGCSSCDIFPSVIKSFLESSNYLLPYLDLDSYNQALGTDSLGSSAFLFYSEGKLLKSQLLTADFNSSKALSNLISNNTVDASITLYNSCQSIGDASAFSLIELKDSLKDDDTTSIPFSLETFNSSSKSLLLIDIDKMDLAEVDSYFLKTKKEETNLLFLSSSSLSDNSTKVALGLDINLELTSPYYQISYSPKSSASFTALSELL